METLGGFLKGLRERASLSQEAVSAKAELSETYYGKIEGDKRRPDALTLLRVLAVLDATAAEESAAIRLFTSARFPAAFVVKLQAALPPRPTPGATASVVPSRKRRRQKRLAVWLFALGSVGVAAGTANAGGSVRPITSPTGGILSRSRKGAYRLAA